MKKFLLILTLTVAATQADTYFYIRPTVGGLLNSGSDTNASPKINSANGAWDVTGTWTYTFAGAPDLSPLTTNDWVTINADAATTNNFSARITTINNTTKVITLSGTGTGVAGTNSYGGVIPSTAASGMRAVVGGAMGGGVLTNNYLYPFDGWFSPAMTNGWNMPHIYMQGDAVAFNAKKHEDSTADCDTVDYGTASYRINYPMVHTRGAQPMIIEAYETIPGDITADYSLGFVKWVGDTNGSTTCYVPWSWNQQGLEIRNFWFSGGGRHASTGAHTNGMVTALKPMTFRHCAGSGSWESTFRISTSAGPVFLIDCIAQGGNFNTGNAEGLFKGETDTILINCVAADSRSDGSGVRDAGGFSFVNSDQTYVMINCISKNIYGANYLLGGNRTFYLVYNCGAIQGQNGAYDWATTQTNSGISHIINSYAYKTSHGIRGGSATIPGFGIPQAVKFSDYSVTNAVWSLVDTGGILSTNHATSDPLTDGVNFDLSQTTGSTWRQVGWQPIMSSSAYSGTTLSVPDIGPVQSTNSASGGSTVVGGGFVGGK